MAANGRRASPGKGYAREAIELLTARIKATANARVLLLDHVKGAGSAGPFFRKLGFEYTGDELKGALVMKMEFTS